MYDKESAYVVLEAGKPQDLQGGWASWRPRRASALVPVQNLAGLNPGIADKVSVQVPKQNKS